MPQTTANRKPFEANGHLQKYRTTLHRVLHIRQETTTAEINLTPRFKNIRDFRSIKESEPKLDSKIADLKAQIDAENRKIKAISRNQGVLKQLKENFRGYAKQDREVLAELRQDIDEFKQDLASKLGIEYGINSTQTGGSQALEYRFTTTDQDCRKMLEESDFEPHTDGSWATEAVVAVLVSLKNKKEEVAQQLHEEKTIVQERDGELSAERARLGEFETELSTETERSSALQGQVEEWKKKYERLAEETSNFEELYEELQEYRAGAEDLDKMTAERDNLRDELGQKEGRTGELEEELRESKAEIEKLKGPESAGTKLVEKIDDLNKQLQAKKEEVEKKDTELTEANEIRKTQSDGLQQAQSACTDLKGLIVHLITYAADPHRQELDVSRLRPFFQVDRTLLEVDVSPDHYVGKSQMALANWYSGYEGPFTLSMLEIVAAGMSIELQATDDLHRAISLQQAVGDMKAEETSVSAVYQFALTQAQDANFKSSAFAVTCALLEDLNRRFPGKQAEEFPRMLQAMLQKRYGGDKGIHTTIPLLEQLCVYHLSLSVGEAAKEVHKYCPAVIGRIASKGESEESIEKGLHVAEIAAKLFNDQGLETVNGVATHQELEVCLVAIHDRSGEYIFWKRHDEAQWVFSTQGSEVKVSMVGGRARYGYKPATMPSAPDAPVFEAFSVNASGPLSSASRLLLYIKQYHAGRTGAKEKLASWGKARASRQVQDRMDTSQ